jgi:phage terminase large subunit-like protein
VTDDIEQGPDANEVRRHAKKFYTEQEYRKRYRRLDFYRPNRKQLEFHNTNVPELMLRAGNQQGKTHAAAAQMTMDSLGLYPENWYKGRRFLIPPKIERPYDFIGWYGCTTSGKTRDGAQVKLLGDIRQQGGLGTGLIPLDNIVGRPTMARGITDFVDTINLTRETGGSAILRGKTFEMGREAWQGEAVDAVWGDEDPGDDAVYGECLARLTTTNGRIIWSMSPLLGATPVRKRYKTKHPGTAEVVMGIDDALASNGGHIPDEDLATIEARYKASERQTRLYGADMQGEGAVFETPIDRIKHTLDPASVPTYWPWLWALDFRHSGQESGGHPFAAVLLTWDRDNDTIYIMDAFRMFGMAANHVARIKESPMRDAPVAWPHDGGRGAGIVTGETVAAIYKKLGLTMRPTHATFPDGGYNFEAGITVLEERLAGGKLRVAAHLAEWFDEYQGYHRVNGLVHKVDDDLLSATRVGCMDLRFAKMPERFPQYRRGGEQQQLADGIDFDVFTGT